jgi:hypothetical protein
MLRCIKVFRVTNGASKLEWFKWVRVVERGKLSYQIRSFGLEPKVEEEVTGVESSTCVHQPAKGRVSSMVTAQIKGQMGKAIVNGDGHGRGYRMERR